MLDLKKKIIKIYILENTNKVWQILISAKKTTKKHLNIACRCYFESETRQKKDELNVALFADLLKQEHS